MLEKGGVRSGSMRVHLHCQDQMPSALKHNDKMDVYVFCPRTTGKDVSDRSACSGFGQGYRTQKCKY